MKSEKGFTLIELIIVIGIIAIAVSIASLDSGIVRKSKLAEQSKKLLANTQKVRNDAMTQRSVPTSLGYGIRFVSKTQYRTFEFIDINNNYKYDGPVEEKGGEFIDLPNPVKVTLGESTDPADDVFLFDLRGILKNDNWSSVSGRTYVLWFADEPPRCISLSLARIREGHYNQSANDCEEI